MWRGRPRPRNCDRQAISSAITADELAGLRILCWAREGPGKTIRCSIVALFLVGALQARCTPGEAADPRGQEPLEIDALTGFIHLLSKPELAYPKEALQQHIEGKVELELSVSPQGEVVSERAFWVRRRFSKPQWMPSRK